MLLSFVSFVHNILCRGKISEIKRGPDLHIEDKYVFSQFHSFSFFCSAISFKLTFYNNASCFVKHLIFFNRKKQWTKASPWLTGINPRDAIMPKDGDDGFYPTTGNDLVSYSVMFYYNFIYLGGP